MKTCFLPRVCTPLILLFLAFTTGCSETGSMVCFAHSCIDAEIADSAAERAQGLMFRESIGEEQGMLFVFEEPGIYKFWMKNTLIPLDIIWVDEESIIVHIHEAQPCTEDSCPSFGPDTPSRYVIEVNQGYAEEHGIMVGQKVKLPG